MRHRNLKENETPLTSATMDDLPSPSDLTPRTLDIILVRARQMRAEATAQLLSRLGTAILRPIRGWMASRRAQTRDMFSGGPQGAV